MVIGIGGSMKQLVAVGIVVLGMALLSGCDDFGSGKQASGNKGNVSVVPNEGRLVGRGRMEVDGHQIYYDVRNEEWLLDWQAQGMTELYFPLPGRRDLMVCPLEIVVRRGSGGCRVVQPDDPDLPNIGDARKVVHVVRVYRRGELVWSGPGAYK